MVEVAEVVARQTLERMISGQIDSFVVVAGKKQVVEAEVEPLPLVAEVGVVEAACSVATRVHSIYTVAYLPRRPCGLRSHHPHSHLRYLRYSPPSSSQLPMRPVPQ